MSKVRRYGDNRVSYDVPPVVIRRPDMFGRPQETVEIELTEEEAEDLGIEFEEEEKSLAGPNSQPSSESDDSSSQPSEEESPQPVHDAESRSSRTEGQESSDVDSTGTSSRKIAKKKTTSKRTADKSKDEFDFES